MPTVWKTAGFLNNCRGENNRSDVTASKAGTGDFFLEKKTRFFSDNKSGGCSEVPKQARRRQSGTGGEDTLSIWQRNPTQTSPDFGKRPQRGPTNRTRRERNPSRFSTAVRRENLLSNTPESKQGRAEGLTDKDL